MSLSLLYGPYLIEKTQEVSSVSAGAHSCRSLFHICGSSEADKTRPDSPCSWRQFVYTSWVEKWVSLVPGCGFGTRDEEFCIMRFPVWKVGIAEIWLQLEAANTEIGTRYFRSHYLPHTEEVETKDIFSPNHHPLWPWLWWGRGENSTVYKITFEVITFDHFNIWKLISNFPSNIWMYFLVKKFKNISYKCKVSFVCYL